MSSLPPSSKVDVSGVTLHLRAPDRLDFTWIGQEEPMRQLLAAWYVVDSTDLPMNPRITGKPGSGKTTLAYAAAQRLGREVYVMQATPDMTTDRLLVAASGMASPLVSAVVRGGICILDEANRMTEPAWACLAPLLDHRRYLDCAAFGIKIPAHPLFRLVATVNDDSATFDIPPFIHSRLQPQILVDFPDRVEELAILRENVPLAEDQILNTVTDFLQRAHAADERYTVRDGINAARYAMKLHLQRGIDRKTALRTAFEETLGPEALRHAPGV